MSELIPLLLTLSLVFLINIVQILAVVKLFKMMEIYLVAPRQEKIGVLCLVLILAIGVFNYDAYFR